MATYTRDEVIRRLQRGDKMDRADLKGLDLSKVKAPKAVFDRADLDGVNLESAELAGATLRRASLREAYLVGANLAGANLENTDLEGAKLERANLAGASLGYAQLAGAKLGGANLAEAILTHAELDDAYLGGVSAPAANLGNASLANANLEDAKLVAAVLDEAVLHRAIARNADLSKTSLVKTNLSGADLSGANLTGADIRYATVARAQLAGAQLTGAKIAGLIGTGVPVEAVQVAWLDVSPAGDGTQRIENGVIPSMLAQGATAKAPAETRHRYFGRGDTLRNATLQFDAGAKVEIDSVFQNCTINIGEATELVIGADGVLADCEIVGAGAITIHGKFFERKSPGIVGPRNLNVSARGAVVSAIQQHQALTSFGFESGCQLRVKIFPAKPSDNHEVKR